VKLQIVHLEPHDDRVSARDKLRAVKADRALLVWPRHGTILQSRVDLALLQREAESNGVQLGLLTHDPRVRDHARHQRIPLFDNLDRLPEKRWQRAGVPQQIERPADEPQARAAPDELPGPSQPSARPGPPQPWLRWTAAGLAFLALALLSGALVPSATIVLAVGQTQQSRILRLGLEPAMPPSEPSETALTADQVRATVSASDRRSATGRQSVPTNTAHGTLLFVNLTRERINIPAGTSVRVSSDPSVYYQTVEPASLPADEGAQVQVAAAASVPGIEGNAEAESIDAVDGPIGLNITVSNPEAFEGGSESRQPTVRQSDLDSLRRSVLGELELQAAAQLTAQLSEGERLATASVTIDRVLSEAYDAGAGDLAASVGLSMEAEASGLVYHVEDLEKAARQMTEGTLTKGWQVVTGSVRLTRIRSLVRPDGNLQIEMTVQWRLARSFDPARVARLVAGLTIDDAQQRIDSISEMELSAVEIWPKWLRRLPWIPVRISIKPNWERR
jgi:hypothetical protein